MNCPECNSENLKKQGIIKNRQRYRCKDCGRYFIEGAKPAKPLLQITCPHCSGKHINRSGTEISPTTGEPIQRYLCKDCGRKFSSLTRVSPPVKYKCPYCDGKLRRSGHTKLGEQEYICTECGKSCSGDPPKKNLSFCKTNTDIICPYCNGDDIKLMGFNPSGNRRYQCKKCKKIFSNVTRANIEKEKQKTEVCPYCKSMKIISAGKSPGGNQRYRCLVCRKTYTKTLEVPIIKYNEILVPDRDKKLIAMYYYTQKQSVLSLSKYFNYPIITIKQIINSTRKYYRKEIK